MENIGETLQRIENLVGGHDARVVLQQVRRDLVESIKSLDRSALAENAKSFRSALHGLAGTLSTFGFCNTYDECQSLVNSPADVVPDFEELRRRVLIIASQLEEALGVSEF